ncbi:hypothetical protein MHK_001180 [Candidatus Magnetomorum sp. HK-1]|nr:hypothetical protein MHK_001180 [Candidatus Magnetomorum sp. HK-1]
MNQMIKSILSWGDISGDQKIGLEEVVRSLRITSGVVEPAIK